MENKLILVDADSLCFQSSRETLQESIQIMDEKIQNMYDKTEATHAAFFITSGDSFRKAITPSYKANRGKYQNKLKFLRSLKSYLIEEYAANSMKNVEADDLVAFWNLKVIPYGDHLELYPDSLFNRETKRIICSPDKDILQRIAGTHFNYSYKDEDNKGWWVETSLGDALNFQFKQLIWGDASDNILTPFPENCANYLTNNGIGLTEILEGYMNGFHYETPTGLKKFVQGYGTSLGIYKFQEVYRLLQLLDTDELMLREVGQIPEIPNIIEIKKPEIIEY